MCFWTLIAVQENLVELLFNYITTLCQRQLKIFELFAQVKKVKANLVKIFGTKDVCFIVLFLDLCAKEVISLEEMEVVVNQFMEHIFVTRVLQAKLANIPA